MRFRSTILPLVTLMSVVFFGCAATADDLGTAEQDVEASRKVELRLAAFIPCEGISAMGVFDGDGRGFGYAEAASSSRMLLDVTVDPDGPGSSRGKAFPSKKFDGAAVIAKDGWCARLAPDARPTEEATADSKRIYAEITEIPDWNGHKGLHVTLEVHGKNPLVSFAPNTDATFEANVFFRKEQSKWVPAYLVYRGSHDGFPNWELYADKEPLVQHDARRLGYGPFSMIGSTVTHDVKVCSRTDDRWLCK